MGLARNTTSGEKRERQSLAAFAMVASCAVSPGDAFATQTTLPLQMRLYCGEFQLNVSSDERLWRSVISPFIFCAFFCVYIVGGVSLQPMWAAAFRYGIGWHEIFVQPRIFPSFLPSFLFVLL